MTELEVLDFAKLGTYALDPRYLDISDVNTGDGVDLSDYLNPVKTELTLFPDKPKEEPLLGSKAGLDVAPVTLSYHVIYRLDMEEKEHEIILRGYFKATYGLSSISASVGLSKKLKQKKKFVYILLTHTGESRTLEPEFKQVNKEADEFINILEKDQTLSQEDVEREFIARYGTHYVAEIVYGLRIGIEASVDSSSKHEAVDIGAKLKATFGAFSAEGGIDTNSKKSVEDMKVDFQTEITSGGVLEPSMGMPILTSVDGIYEYLRKISNGEIVYRVAPIKVVLKPYWIFIDRSWSKLRKFFDPGTIHVRKTPFFGVPRGTIVAWHPTDQEIENHYCPVEWAICDGKDGGTPDLRNYFIRGTGQHDKVLETGGSMEHNHTDIPGPDVLQPGHGHRMHITFESANHLPPYVNLLYIMKL